MTSRAATEYRYEKLTWPEINDAVEMNKVCIVPCGAVEQHGPHLPLDVCADLIGRPLKCCIIEWFVHFGLVWFLSLCVSRLRGWHAFQIGRGCQQVCLARLHIGIWRGR